MFYKKLTYVILSSSTLNKIRVNWHRFMHCFLEAFLVGIDSLYLLRIFRTSHGQSQSFRPFEGAVAKATMKFHSFNYPPNQNFLKDF